MFLRARADFVIAFSDAISRLKPKYSDIEFHSYQIANVPAVFTSHLMCNKRPESATLIDELNQSLSILYKQPEFISAHTDFLPLQDHAMLTQYIAQYATQKPAIEP
jgi:hypothetical protein